LTHRTAVCVLPPEYRPWPSANAAQLFWKGRFILGGYQVNRIPEAQFGTNYPSFKSDDYFIRSFAEREIERIVLGKASRQILSGSTQTTDLPSPYLSGTIPVCKDAPMLRWETRRGYCIYKCDYCESRKLDTNSTLEELPFDRLVEELWLFKKRHVREVNVLDLVFNYHFDKREKLIAEMMKCGIKFKVQCRLELLGDSFFDAFTKQSNFHFEFGIQSIDEKTCASLDRKNNIHKMEENLSRLSRGGITYSVNLIYGIPDQTVDTFQKDIDWLCRNKCKPQSIVCFPLQIPRYTNLEQNKEDYKVTERILPLSFVPIVTSSRSFSETDFLRMRLIASRLKKGPDRLFGNHYKDLGSMNSVEALTTIRKFRIFLCAADGSLDWKFNSERLLFSNQHSCRNNWELLSPTEAVHVLTDNKRTIIRKNRIIGKCYLLTGFYYDFSREECVLSVKELVNYQTRRNNGMYDKTKPAQGQAFNIY
jgi:hypothetical protein